jgi:hypothetical protein
VTAEAPARIARRFPLVARARPACKALQARVREVGDLARAAAAATGADPLPMAASAHNMAALIASDSGMPELARSLCWRQHHVYSRCRPLNAQAARFACEPLVNLARLMIRGDDGEGAYRLLDALYQAVTSRVTAAIDGTSLSLGDLTDSVESHQTVCRWLWTVLLADGVRALAAAGQWERALTHAERLGGVGLRLLDGRQVAIIERCLAGDCASAAASLQVSATPTSWERCVAACLNVLYLMCGARPAGSAIADMVEQYLELRLTGEFTAFCGRLGLAVMDLAGGVEQPQAERAARHLVSQAMAAGDGYLARDVLAHACCRALLAGSEEQRLSVTVQSAGLGRGSMPEELQADLLAAAEMSESVVARHLPAGGPASRR